MDIEISDHSGLEGLWADHPNLYIPALPAVVQLNILEHLSAHNLPRFKRHPHKQSLSLDLGFFQQHPLAFSVPILTNTTVPRHCKQNNYAFVFLSQATTLGVNYTATKILNKTSLMIFPSTRHQLIISIMKSMGRGTKVVSRMIYRCRDTSSFFLNIRAAPPEKCDETNI